MSSIFEATSITEFKNAALKLFVKTLFIVVISSITSYIFLLCYNKHQSLENVECVEEEIIEEWKLQTTDVIVTVYNAVPAQCNRDFGVTASMFYLDLYDVEAHRIIAMERTFMKSLGLVYGDIVKIEGTGKYDGIYQIQDTMNKRFAGQHKIDILVNENIKYGKWNNVKIYTLINKNDTTKYSVDFKPEITKSESKIQMGKKRKEWKNKKK